MEKTESSTIKLTAWPTPQDYNEAVQNLLSNTMDSQLQAGTIAIDALGLPRPITGSFASVYKITCKQSNFALRCFLRNIKDQETRYAAISDFIQHDDLPYTVTFDFMKEGMKVNGQWFPALKMEWVDGRPLDAYISANLGDPHALAALAEKFKVMCLDLHKQGIAHGDLQHGNILVIPDGNLRLVDYDGIFVPVMQSMQSNELGHRNYQHPKRTAHHFGPYLDNFSAWVIYASLRAIATDTRLYALLQGGDDCLLFRKRDFDAPQNSRAFILLEKSHNTEVRELARFIRAQLQVEPDQVPALCDSVPEVDGLEALPAQPQLTHEGVGGPANQQRLTIHAAVNESPNSANGTSPAGPNQDPWWLASVGQKNATSHAATSASSSGPALSRSTDPRIPPHVASALGNATGQYLQPLTVSPPACQLSVSELELKGTIPRIPRWAAQATLVSPSMFQWLMLVNPLVWAMIVTWTLGLGGNLGALNVAIWTTAVNAILELLIWRRPFQARQLVKYGTAVVGRIERKIMKLPSTAATSPPEPNFCLVYSFCTKDGLVIVDTATVSEAEYNQVQEGELLTVLYRNGSRMRPGVRSLIYQFCPYKADLAAAVGNPAPVAEGELNRLTPREVQWNETEGLVHPVVWQLAMLANPLVWIAVACALQAGKDPSAGVGAAVFFAICAALEACIWWKPLRDREFVKSGTAVVGKIEKLTEQTFNGSGLYYDTTYSMRYSFLTAKGNRVVHELNLPVEKYQLLKEGQDITILYRENGSEVTSIVYKFCCYRAVF